MNRFARIDSRESPPIRVANRGYFFIYLLFRGRGKGGVRGAKGWGTSISKQRGGRVFEEGRRGGAHRGWEGVAERRGGG